MVSFRAGIPESRSAPSTSGPSGGYQLYLPRGGGQGKGIEMEVAVGETISTRRPWVGCVNFVNEHKGIKINCKALFCHLLEIALKYLSLNNVSLVKCIYSK